MWCAPLLGTALHMVDGAARMCFPAAWPRQETNAEQQEAHGWLMTLASSCTNQAVWPALKPRGAGIKRLQGSWGDWMLTQVHIKQSLAKFVGVVDGFLAAVDRHPEKSPGHPSEGNLSAVVQVLTTDLGTKILSGIPRLLLLHLCSLGNLCHEVPIIVLCSCLVGGNLCYARNERIIESIPESWSIHLPGQFDHQHLLKVP
mmetsp:Transcript_29204/g.82403  ORF Transcript_29204/g.82403 Transcript_29204/m.82403 type:complete len:201 (+) Transcript_29204:455-1057(+)